MIKRKTKYVNSFVFNKKQEGNSICYGTTGNMRESIVPTGRIWQVSKSALRTQ